MADATDPTSFLPLRPVELQILASLAEGPRHGYSILKEAEERGEGGAVPGLATLYRALRRLDERELIRQADEEDPEEDERRRTYSVTPLGSRVLHAELRRLRELASLAGEAWAVGEEG